MSQAPISGGLHPLVDSLAGQIRLARAALPELTLLPVDPELEAITGSLDGESLFIRNEVHQCRGLRKLHLEIARLGAGLLILHCVFFPDPRYELPIFGTDIVASRAGVSAAIVDLSPVDSSLPRAIAAALQAQKRPDFAQVRDLPAWATIFSPYVLFVRPEGPKEENWFVREVTTVLAIMAKAVREARPDDVCSPATIRRWDGQVHYCRQQKQNDKTRRVLEKAFSPAWADRYIEELLFDEPSNPSASWEYF